MIMADSFSIFYRLVKESNALPGFHPSLVCPEPLHHRAAGASGSVTCVRSFGPVHEVRGPERDAIAGPILSSCSGGCRAESGATHPVATIWARYCLRTQDSSPVHRAMTIHGKQF